MTNQTAFNKVWRWFIVKEKPRSFNEGGCMYRDVKGNKCAIGVLIPDNLYISDMDDCSNSCIRKDFIENFKLTKLFKGVNLDMLINMQAVHDMKINWKDDGTLRDEYLRKVAKHFELKIPKK